jgi:hypothetical protein
MSVNLNHLGDEIVGWLKLFEEQEDTSGLQQEVHQACCEKPIDSKETAIGRLLDLSEKLKDAHFLSESEPQLLIAKKISELAQVEEVSKGRAPVETKRKAEETLAEPPKARAKAAGAEPQEKVAISQPSTQSEIEEVRHYRQLMAKLSDFASRFEPFFSKLIGEVVACSTEEDDSSREVAYHKEIDEKMPALERERHQLEAELKQCEEELMHAVEQGKISKEAAELLRREMYSKSLAVAAPMMSSLSGALSQLLEKACKS